MSIKEKASSSIDNLKENFQMKFHPLNNKSKSASILKIENKL